VRNGFAYLHRQAKKYKQEYGCYPERICADRIYINTKNRNLCTRNDIRLSGKRLRRPPKNPEISAVHKQQLSADQRRRNEVERYFGSGKRQYSLDLIMARLSKSAENSISMAFVVMCAEKIRRILRLFFITIFAWLCTWKWPGSLCMGLRNIWLLENTNHWPLDNRAFGPPTPCYLAAIGSRLRFSLSGVPNYLDSK
jgi:transposase, IS5 family